MLLKLLTPNHTWSPDALDHWENCLAHQLYWVSQLSPRPPQMGHNGPLGVNCVKQKSCSLFSKLCCSHLSPLALLLPWNHHLRTPLPKQGTFPPCLLLASFGLHFRTIVKHWECGECTALPHRGEPGVPGVGEEEVPEPPYISLTGCFRIARNISSPLLASFSASVGA